MHLRSFLGCCFDGVEAHGINLVRLNYSSKSRPIEIRCWIIVLAVGALMLSGCVKHELTRESDLVVGHVTWTVPAKNKVKPDDENKRKPLCTPPDQIIIKKDTTSNKPDISNCLQTGELVRLPVLLADSDNLSNGLQLTLNDLIIGTDQSDVSPWYNHPSTYWSKKDEVDHYPVEQFVDSCVAKGGKVDVKKVSDGSGLSLSLKVNFISPIDPSDPTSVNEEWMNECDCLTTTNERYRGCFADRVIGLVANLHNICENTEKFSCSGKDLLGRQYDLPLYLTKGSFNKLSTSVFSPTASYESYLQRSRGLRVGFGVMGERVLPGESICIHSSQGGDTFIPSLKPPHVNTQSIGTTECYEVNRVLPLVGQIDSSMSVDPLAAWYPLKSLTRWRNNKGVKPQNSAHSVLTEPDAIGRLGEYEADNRKLKLKDYSGLPSQAMYLVRQLPLRLEGETISRSIDHPKFDSKYFYRNDIITPHPSSLITSNNAPLIDYFIDRWGATNATDGACYRFMSLAAQSSKLFINKKENRWKDVCDGINDTQCSGDIAPTSYGELVYNLFPASNDPHVAFNITVNKQVKLVRTGTTVLHILQKNFGGGANPAGINLIEQEVGRVLNASKTLTIKRQGLGKTISIDLSPALSRHDLMIPLLPGDKLSW